MTAELVRQARRRLAQDQAGEVYRGHLLHRPAAAFPGSGRDYDNSKLYALVVMHMAFVMSALLLTYIDRLAIAKKVDGGH